MVDTGSDNWLSTIPVEAFELSYRAEPARAAIVRHEHVRAGRGNGVRLVDPR